MGDQSLGLSAYQKTCGHSEQNPRATSGFGEANRLMVEWFATRKTGTANAYDFFMTRGPEVAWASMVWRPKIMPKHRFFLWLLAHERLQTTDRLSYEENKICVLCHGQDESNDHVFFDCPVTRVLWNKVRSWLEINHDVNSVTELFHILGQHYKGASRKIKARYVEISSMIYVLWEIRNRCRYEGMTPDIIRMLKKIQIHVYRFVDFSRN
ncbi:uncharacterized protein LOC121991262 [Zingiber officinale]|uniref:uncharacterized protein LOC121991262 n=1 Tax=Zingiber officinale TaxID=94328 RepID=UPI001C4AB4D3|nr:uncharacterized protein LOC121991262 [Zingiber officinale]